MRERKEEEDYQKIRKIYAALNLKLSIKVLVCKNYL